MEGADGLFCGVGFGKHVPRRLVASRQQVGKQLAYDPGERLLNI